MFMNLSRDYKNLILISATIVVSSVFFFGASILGSTYAQSLDKITISLNSVNYAPLTDKTTNQVKAVVHYETNDPTLVNAKINGAMEVFAPNGTKVKTSTAGGGFILAGPSNNIQFATSFKDPAMTSVNVDVVLTDANKTQDLSNHVTGEATLNATGGLAASAAGGQAAATTDQAIDTSTPIQ
jgi:hypothetical protein